MNASLSNDPPLKDRLAIKYQDLASEIAGLLAGLKKLPVVSDDDAIAVGKMAKPLVDVGKKVEKARKYEKDEYLRGSQAVDDFFKDLVAKVNAWVTAYTDDVSAYQQAKLAAQRKAEEERRRQEQERQEAAEVLDVELPTETRQPRPLSDRAAVRIGDVGSVAVSGRVPWDYVIEDANLLPRDLLMPNAAAIKAAIAGIKAWGKPVTDAKIPGIRIFEKAKATFR